MGRQRILYILLPSLQPQVREINCFTSSLVSWLIRELQKAKGGMFLKISKIWKDTSANNYGQPFSNFWNWNVLGLQLNSARFESTECPQDWVSIVLCSWGEAQMQTQCCTEHFRASIASLVRPRGSWGAWECAKGSCSRRGGNCLKSPSWRGAKGNKPC